MLFKEADTVSCDKHVKHIGILWTKLSGICSNPFLNVLTNIPDMQTCNFKQTVSTTQCKY
jgi:hypothetical protein